MADPQPRWTTAADVQNAWLGDPTEYTAETVNAWICRAERRLARDVPNLQARIDSGTEPELAGLVADVVAEMVEAKLRNPDGVRSRTSTTGPVTDTVTVGGDNPGQLWVTPAQLALLAPPATRGRAFSVDLYDGPRTNPWAAPVTTVGVIPPLPGGFDPLTGARVNGPDNPHQEDPDA